MKRGIRLMLVTIGVLLSICVSFRDLSQLREALKRELKVGKKNAVKQVA